MATVEAKSFVRATRSILPLGTIQEHMKFFLRKYCSKPKRRLCFADNLGGVVGSIIMNEFAEKGMTVARIRFRVQNVRVPEQLHELPRFDRFQPAEQVCSVSEILARGENLDTLEHQKMFILVFEKLCGDLETTKMSHDCEQWFSAVHFTNLFILSKLLRPFHLDEALEHFMNVGIW